jgi:hypothetical protein
MIKNALIIALITTNVMFAWAYIQSTAAPSHGQQPVPQQVVKQIEPTPPVTISQKPAVVQAQTDTEVVSQLSYPDMISELRDQGFDEATIRQMMLARLNRDHATSQSSLSETPYWRPEEVDAEARLNSELRWEADRREQLIGLFGAEIVDDPLFANIFKPLNATLGFLSSDKQIRLDELQRLDQAKTQSLFRNGFTQESRDDLAAQRAALERQISELLGSNDNFEYQLRESRLAETMRRGLGDFDYSEAEFRDIFSIRQANEGNSQSSRFIDRREYREQRDQSEAEIRDYLGANRYEEYARSQDPAYRSLQSIGERYGNSTAEINDVYTITQETQEQIDELRNSASLDREERIERINDLRNEAYQQIEQIAGKDTAESVKDNSRRLGLGRGFRPSS